MGQLLHGGAEVKGGEAAVLVQDSAPNHGHGHIAALGRPHKSIQDIVAGNQMGGGKIHQHDVRIHALAQHTALAAAALGLGAGDGGHHQGGGGRQGGSIPGAAALCHGGIADDFKQIQIAALHRTAGAQRHIHPGLHAVGNGGGGQAVLGGAQGSGYSSYFFSAQNRTLLRFQEGAACGGGGDGKEVVTVEKLPGTHAGAIQTGIHLALALRQMKLKADALFAGVACQSLPQPVVAGVLGIDAGVDFDPAVVIAVPLVHHPAQLLTLLVGVKVEFLVLIDEAVGRQRQIGLDAGLRHSLGGGVGVVVQVGDGGGSKAQALGNGHRCGGFGGAGVHLGLLLQQGFQCLAAGEVVGKAAQHGGCQMGVAVDEAGDGHHAGAVHNGFRGLLRGGLGDGDDFAVGNADIGSEEHLHFGVHGHRGDIGNQGIHGRLSFPGFCIRRNMASFWARTSSIFSIYCSGNLGLWNR